MACSPNRSAEAGYATLAALVLSLALAMIGTAISAHTLQLLRQARLKLERARFELVLDGAHLEAAAMVIRSGRSGPFAWKLGSEVGLLRVTAEPEADKLGPSGSQALTDPILGALGVQSPDQLRESLAAMTPDRAATGVASLDPAPLWRACGRSLVSPGGRAERLVWQRPTTPDPGREPPAWHIGESWRILVSTPTGWRDDRIVRFTGSARSPVAVVERDFSKGGDRWGQCEEALAAATGG